MVQPQEDSASLDVSDISVSCQQYTGLYRKTRGLNKERNMMGGNSGRTKNVWKCSEPFLNRRLWLLNVALPFIWFYTAHPNKKKEKTWKHSLKNVGSFKCVLKRSFLFSWRCTDWSLFAVTVPEKNNDPFLWMCRGQQTRFPPPVTVTVLPENYEPWTTERWHEQEGDAHWALSQIWLRAN